MNSKRIGQFLASVIVALALIGCASTAKEESVGEFLDDSVLTTKVKAALVKDPTVSAMDVNVETFKGLVQLSGFVKTAAQRDQAAKVANGVGGVTQVINDIKIR